MAKASSGGLRTRALVGAQDPVGRALTVVGKKWSLLIVRHLIPGHLRFTEIQRSLQADPKVLTARLRELEMAGLVSRTTYAEVPPRVEYALTEPGRALEPVVDALRQWGSAYAGRALRFGRGSGRAEEQPSRMVRKQLGRTRSAAGGGPNLGTVNRRG